MADAFRTDEDEEEEEEVEEEGSRRARLDPAAAAPALEDPATLFRRLRKEGETLAEADRFWRAVHTWDRGLQAVEGAWEKQKDWLEGEDEDDAAVVRRGPVGRREVAEVLEMKAQALMQVHK